MSASRIAECRRTLACLAVAGLLLAGCEGADSVSYGASVSYGYGYDPYYYGYPWYGGEAIVVQPPGERPPGDHVSTLPSGPGAGTPPPRPPSAQPRASTTSSMPMSRPPPRPMGGGGRRR